MRVPQMIGQVLVFRVAEIPNFVALDPLAFKIAENFILINRASLTEIGQEFQHGVIAHANDPRGSVDRISLH